MKVSRSWLERHAAYRIDPLLAQTVEVDSRSGLCRIDGEVDAGDFWKSRHPALWFWRRP